MNVMPESLASDGRETSGGRVRWEDTPNRHAYCDGEIARLRARLGAAEAMRAEVGQVIATFLQVRGEEGTADLAEAVRQVIDREPLGGQERSGGKEAPGAR